MTTACAWCSKELGRVDPPETSHGICDKHKAIELARFKARPRTPILDEKQRRRTRGASWWLHQAQQKQN